MFLAWSGVGIAPLPAVYAAADCELVCIPLCSEGMSLRQLAAMRHRGALTVPADWLFKDVAQVEEI